jgi:hypothetical protein
MEQVARKWLKWGAFFKSCLEKGTFLEFGAKSRKKGYVLSSQNLKMVHFHRLSQLEKGLILKSMFSHGYPVETK